MSRVCDLTLALLARPSITPDDAGCQAFVVDQLKPLGFSCETLRFGAVENLWARRGTKAPLFVFLGHTDVVPTGPLEQWHIPPFSPTIKEGCIYGRGASDMKGGVAAFIVSIENFLRQHQQFNGSIAVLLTSDEEGPSIDGVKQVVKVLATRNEKIDYCITGEPTCEQQFGDIIKIGRRGSLTGNLTIYGKQGHIAFPHLFDNPIHRFVPALEKLCRETWDNGNEFFQPTGFQIANIQAGTGAANIVPGELHVQFNFRFSTESSAQSLQQRVNAILDAAQLSYKIDWQLGGEPFLTRQGKLREACIQAVREITQIEPDCCTLGGTSDARFIAPMGSEVLEFGPRTTAHQINESVRIDDLENLVRVYQRVLEMLLT